jgi:hypothetical protein
VLIFDVMDDFIIGDGGTSAIINPPFHQKSTIMYSSIVNQSKSEKSQNSG